MNQLVPLCRGVPCLNTFFTTLLHSYLYTALYSGFMNAEDNNSVRILFDRSKTE